VKLQVGILVFDDAEELDFTGPLGVFSMSARFGAPCTTAIVAESLQPVRCREGLVVVPAGTIAAETFDILIVPGGLGARTHALQNQNILSFVRLPHRYIASVCTGALILAAAGVLQGERATTHHGSLDTLRRYKGVEVCAGARFILGEKVGTSAGVTAGIDLSLALVRRTWGEKVAELIAENLEWQGTQWRCA